MSPKLGSIVTPSAFLSPRRRDGRALVGVISCKHDPGGWYGRSRQRPLAQPCFPVRRSPSPRPVLALSQTALESPSARHPQLHVLRAPGRRGRGPVHRPGARHARRPLRARRPASGPRAQNRAAGGGLQPSFRRARRLDPGQDTAHRASGHQDHGQLHARPDPGDGRAAHRGGPLWQGGLGQEEYRRAQGEHEMAQAGRPAGGLFRRARCRASG